MTRSRRARNRGDGPEQQALALGLSPATAKRCADLAGRGWPDPQDAQQPERDFFRLYAAAKSRAEVFRQKVEDFGTQQRVASSTRPGDVKRLDRIVEKYSVSLELPLDLLGGKVVVGNLTDLYRVAVEVADHFQVVGYADRTLSPQKSGYRDLQFIVAVEGAAGEPDHYAELKVMHTLFDQMDGYEHRLYEIRRGLEARKRDQLREPQTEQEAGEEAPPVLSTVEQIVLTELAQTSQTLFDHTWKLVQEQSPQP